MEKYELTYFCAPGETTDTVGVAIKELSGVVVDQKDLGVTVLAYPISKLTEGQYYSVIFNLEGANLSELEKRVRRDKKIKRHILIRALRARKPLKERKIPDKAPAPELPEKPLAIKTEKAKPKAEPQAKPAKIPAVTIKKSKPAKVKTPKVAIKKPVKTKDESLSSTALDEKLKELTED